jgi:epoxyqueuosine reductase
MPGISNLSASKTLHTCLIREEALRLGFSFVGMARAEQMDEEARRLEAWLNQGKHGKMSYMANHFDKRIDPRKLVEGARSVITLMYNYHTDRVQQDPTAPKISTYAYVSVHLVGVCSLEFESKACEGPKVGVYSRK